MSAVFTLREHLDAGLNSGTVLDRLLVHIFHAKTSMLKRKLLSYSGFHYWKDKFDLQLSLTVSQMVLVCGGLHTHDSGVWEQSVTLHNAGEIA